MFQGFTTSISIKSSLRAGPIFLTPCFVVCQVHLEHKVLWDTSSTPM